MLDETYVVSRTVLLDALEALGPHRDAAVLVGAQAIYLHTGAAGLAVAEYTTDGDIVLDPELVPLDPDIALAMGLKGFFMDDKGSGPEIGIWSTSRDIGGVRTTVTVDLLMPHAVSGGGTRRAVVGNHQRDSIRKVRGLEGCLFDRSLRTISALDGSDPRSFEIMVAGPAALLVGKLIKIAERTEEALSGRRDRRKDKDALDVLRLLQTSDPHELARSLEAIGTEPISSDVVREAIAALWDFFGTSGAPGSLMAAAAASPESPAYITASCAALTAELRQELTRSRQSVFVV